MQTPHLDVRFTTSAQLIPRIGLIVPKHKQSAVDRNRLRRRLRELIRLHLLPEVLKGDTLIRAKADAYAVTFESLRAEVDLIKAWLLALEPR
jgi:ribonuclease P protein component